MTKSNVQEFHVLERPAAGWRSMETAPRTGAQVLVLVRGIGSGGRIFVGRFSRTDGCFMTAAMASQNSEQINMPTGWQPLPDLPAEA
jgi:hypothetical protein